MSNEQQLRDAVIRLDERVRELEAKNVARFTCVFGAGLRPYLVFDKETCTSGEINWNVCEEQK